MPMFFFNVVDGKFIVDRDGTECVDMVEVRQEAIRTAGRILEDQGGEFPQGLDWQMHVTDKDSNTVLKLSFSAEEPQIDTKKPALLPAG